MKKSPFLSSTVYWPQDFIITYSLVHFTNLLNNSQWTYGILKYEYLLNVFFHVKDLGWETNRNISKRFK